MLDLPFSSVTVINQIAITIVFALSYNMLLGQGGMLSFGHAIYMGLGGYFTLHILRAVEYGGLTLPLPLVPLFGGLFGLLLSMLMGAFSVRRDGTAFTMISLGICELVAVSPVVISAFFAVSGDRTYARFMGYDFASQFEVYYLILFWLLVSVAAMYFYTLTPVGRLINAVRENPERVEYMGYSAALLRYYAFSMAGFFAGVAGALFAINYEIADAGMLGLAASGEVLMITFLGGVGHFVGPIIGAIVFTLLQTVLSLYTEIWQLYLGILFLAAVMFFPSGLAGLFGLLWNPLRYGQPRLLVWPATKLVLAFLPALVGFCALLEMTHYSNRMAVGEAHTTLFWLDISVTSAAPWIVCLLLFSVGAWAVAGALQCWRAAWLAAGPQS